MLLVAWCAVSDWAHAAPGAACIHASCTRSASTCSDRVWHSDELQLIHVVARETVSFMHAQPGQFATLFARNFAYFCWLPERTGLLYPSSWLAVTRRHLLATLAPPGA